MPRIDKTIFICYRRANISWALAIFQYLTTQGYDVFFDYLSINTGDFEQIILENINSRAHFIIILTPSSLERCNQPDDWLRLEIETAIESKRNIIPLLLENFDFGTPSIAKYLTGKLSLLNKYNGLKVYSDYFFESMIRLCNNHLNVKLSSVLHPVSDFAIEATNKQKAAANEAAPVQQQELSAQELFEKGYKVKDLQEKIYYYKKSIELMPNIPHSYNNLGNVYNVLGKFDEAITYLQKAIELDPNFAGSHTGLGIVYNELGKTEKALASFQKAINLDPNKSSAYRNLGLLYASIKQYELAIENFEIAINLDPNYTIARVSLAGCYKILGDVDKYLLNINLARPLIKNEDEYNQACFYSVCGNVNEAIVLLKIALDKKQVSKQWVRKDPDFDFMRDFPQYKELVY